MQNVSTRELEIWRARLDLIQREIELLAAFSTSDKPGGRVLQRLIRLYEMKRAADCEAQNMTERLIAHRFKRKPTLN